MTEMPGPTTVSQDDYYYDPEVREQIEDSIYGAESLFGAASHEGYLAQIGAAFPDERGYFIPPEGGWVIVKRQPGPLSIPEPPLYSMWFAKPVYMARKFHKIAAGGRSRNISWPMLKARILTVHGELDLWPEEFVPCSDITKFTELIGNGVEMHFLGPEPDEAQVQMFYLRAHGLSVKDATALLLGEMQSNHVYLTVDVGQEEA